MTLPLPRTLVEENGQPRILLQGAPQFDVAATAR